MRRQEAFPTRDAWTLAARETDEHSPAFPLPRIPLISSLVAVVRATRHETLCRSQPRLLLCGPWFQVLDIGSRRTFAADGRLVKYKTCNVSDCPLELLVVIAHKMVAGELANPRWRHSP